MTTNGQLHGSYRRLVWLGVLVLCVGVAAELVREWGPATAALSQWVCDKGTVPLPAGPSGCHTGFLLRWMLSRLPLYIGIVALVMLAVEAVIIVWRGVQSKSDASAGLATAVRLIALAIGVFMLAELAACVGDTTCALSLTCT